MIELAEVLINGGTFLLEIVEFFSLDVEGAFWNMRPSKGLGEFFLVNGGGVLMRRTVVFPPVGCGSSELMGCVQRLFPGVALHQLQLPGNVL